MILGIGIDLVEIERFADWHTKPVSSLERIFHPDEIAYCLSEPAKSAERFAVRFAAREALYKALSSLEKYKRTPFLTLCKKIWVSNGKLYTLGLLSGEIQVHLSLSHSRLGACALVVIEG